MAIKNKKKVYKRGLQLKTGCLVEFYHGFQDEKKKKKKPAQKLNPNHLTANHLQHRSVLGRWVSHHLTEATLLDNTSYHFWTD